MPENFYKKNLRGRNFSGKDLTGANFTLADIRGANFTNAVLINADFSEAQAGLSGKWGLTRLVILFLMATAGFELSLDFCTTILNYLLNSGGWSGVWWTILILVFYVVFFKIIIS